MPPIRFARPVHQDRSRASLEKLMESATTLVRERGLEGTTVEAIASSAKMSAAAIYRRFPDKDALLAAVFERYLATAEESYGQSLRECNWSGKSIDDVLTAFVEAAVKTQRSQGQLLPSLHRFAASYDNPGFRKRAARVNATTHRRIAETLVSAAPTAMRPLVQKRVRFAVDTLIFVLSGFLIERTPASGETPSDRELSASLVKMVGDYLLA